MKIREWLFGEIFAAQFKALELRVSELESQDRRKRKDRAKAIRRARLQHKWMQAMKDQPLTEEEKREWAAGD